MAKKQKDLRAVFIKELAKGVPNRGTIAHISPVFLQQCVLWLGLSHSELAELTGTTRPNVARKIKLAVDTLPDQTAPQAEPKAPELSPLDEQMLDILREQQTAPQQPMTNKPGDGAELSLEQFTSSSLSPEAEYKFLSQFGKRLMAKADPKEQLTIFRLLLERSEKRSSEDLENTKQQAVDLMKDILTAVSESDQALRQSAVWEVQAAVERFLSEITEKLEERFIDLNPDKCRFLNGFNLENNFGDILHEHLKNRPSITAALERYSAREPERVRFSGGGSVFDESSAKGGSFYRAQARKVERERESKGLQ
jgi:hypothetical protein